MTLPRYALILDTETTGIDPKKDCIIEVACILYDLQEASALVSFSSLARPEREVSDASHINGITMAMLESAFMRERVWVAVAELMNDADVIVAHKADFDRGFLEADSSWLDYTSNEGIPKIGDRPWVCTLEQFPWPNRLPDASRALSAIALSYGVALTGAHRAAVDVDILSRTFTRLKEMGFNLKLLMVEAMIPRKLVSALVSYAQRDLAKAAGFRWNPDDKRWIKQCTDEEIKNLKFKTAVIG